MVKTTIKEITEKFDKNGTLIERLTREEFIEDDESCGVVSTTPPITTTTYTPTPATPINPWYGPNCDPYLTKVTSNSEIISNVAELTGKTVLDTHDSYRENDRIFADAGSTCTAKTNAKQYADNSTESTFAQAVSRCISS